MIKNHLGQSVKKGWFSWHTRNKKTSNLLTIRKALYPAWKEGYRKAILLVNSVNLADELATINTNKKKAESSRRYPNPKENVSKSTNQSCS